MGPNLDVEQTVFEYLLLKVKYAVSSHLFVLHKFFVAFV